MRPLRRINYETQTAQTGCSEPRRLTCMSSVTGEGSLSLVVSMNAPTANEKTLRVSYVIFFVALASFLYFC